MIAVVEERNIVRPLIAWIRIKSFDSGIPAIVGQEAEHLRHIKRIIHTKFFHVRLADDHQVGALLRLEKSFHRCECYRLMQGDILSLSIAAGECNEQTCNDTADDTRSNKDPTIVFIFLHEEVIGSDRGHDECRCDNLSRHGVHILPNSPRI
jgi:hypothetical protein